MSKIKISTFLLLALFSFIFISCKDDDDSVSKEVQEINKFVWDNMNMVYFWDRYIPKLDYKTEPDTYEFFDKMLYKDIDRWSLITDDYPGLMDMLSGISKSTGHSFRLSRTCKTCDDLIGFIEYVEPGSPADEAGLHRGQMFFKIDGQKLTINNYQSLLMQDSYDMTFGSFDSNGNIIELTPSVRDLTAIQLQSNPILLHKVIDYEGLKVGYLVYTAFVHEYNEELEAVFADFKAQGVDKLILDLRYNSGGTVSSAILLSSMIAPANKAGEVLIRNTFNYNVTEYFNHEYADDPDYNIDRLQENPNNLNLDELVVLSTYKTASASEMVIYGLSPHMNVYHIGEVTHGKYYGSTPISDPEEKHDWAILPIFMRAENADNSINYSKGLIPDEERYDFSNVASLNPLGDINEDFLARALYHITGVLPAVTQLKSAKIAPLSPLNTESKLVHPLQYEMIYDFK